MFLSKTHLDRRTFLRGMGATVALPLLDAMVPAGRLLAAFAKPAPRLAFVYVPHGAIMNEWATATGGGLTLGRILRPLAPYRHRLTVVSGVENTHAYGPVHALTPGTWLSGCSPRRSGDASPKSEPGGDGVMVGATADQLAADHLGRDTPLPSLSVAAEEPRPLGAGIWEGEYHESYGTTLSFRRAQAPLPMVFRPRDVFDAMFPGGASVDAPGRGAPGTSILDRIAGDARALRNRLGPSDRTALADYFDTIREVERRVDASTCAGPAEAVSTDEGQAAAADRFRQRLTLMFDLVALAFRADVTRVAAVMMAAEASAMTYEHLGVSGSFHLLSHHQNDPEKIEQLVRIQAFHTETFARFVGTLAALPDGDGTILDRTLMLYGSNMSNSHAHDHFPLPLAVVGGDGGLRCEGRHLRCPDRTPIASVLLTLLHRAGVPAPSVGDSTSECAGL